MSLANAFLVALVAKISLAGFAVFNPQNNFFTWFFGFWLPIAVMVAYMIFGYGKTKNSTLDDQLSYGDSCYYLGFLFTIASIILSLYIIGVTKDEFNAADLAIRFAAAMVTTLLGMAIRVYLVTFAKNRFKKKLEETDGEIHGDEPEGGSSQEIYIEAHLKNLEKLNKSLVLNIDATEKLRTNLVNLGARVTNDIELNCKSFQTFTDEMMNQTREIMGNHQKEFQDAMTSCVTNASGQLSEMLSASTSNTQKYVEDSLKKVNTVALDTVEQIDKVANHTVSQVDTLVKNTVGQVDTLVKNSVGQVNTLVKNTVQQVDNVAQNSINRVDNAAQNSIDKMSSVTELSLHKIERSVEGASLQKEKVTSQLEESIENISNASKVFAKRLSVDILPTQEWQESLNKVSLRLNSVVDNFAKKTNDVADITNSAQQKIHDYSLVLTQSTQGVKDELEVVIASFKDTAQEAKQMNVDLERAVHLKADKLERKIDNVNAKTDQLVGQIQQLDQTIKTDSSKKGFIGRFFS